MTTKAWQLAAGIGGAVAAGLIAVKLAGAFKPPEGEVPPVYTCPTCGATFSTQAELNAHIASAHPGTTPPTYHALTVEVVGRAKAGAYEVAKYPIDGAMVALSGPQPGQKVTVGGSVNWASLKDGTYSVTITRSPFTTLTGTFTLDADKIVTFELQGGPIEPTLASKYVSDYGSFVISLLHPTTNQPQAPVQGFSIYADADDPGWGPHHVDAYVFETDEPTVVSRGDPGVRYEYKKPSMVSGTYIVEDLTDEVYFALRVGYTWAVGSNYIDVVKEILERGHWPYENKAVIARYSLAGADFYFDTRSGVAKFLVPIKGIGKFLQVSIRGEQTGMPTLWSHLISEILREATV